jgi:hypothetical protein
VRLSGALKGAALVAALSMSALAARAQSTPATSTSATPTPATPAALTPPAVAPPVDATELVSMFSELCIGAFPDDAKVAAYLKAKAATAMSAQETRRYLHADPGQGWYVRTPVALYGVTIEQPPYHTCAIRRMTPEGVTAPSMKPLVEAEKAYAAGIGGSTVAIPVQNTPIPNGPDVMSFGLGVLDAAGKPSDSFGVFFSNFHGRVAEPWVADGTPGVGLEVRLSHQAIGR